MSETELIRRLTRDLPAGPGLVVGPGDDCAVLESGTPEQRLLLKTDAVVEGVHFTPDADPRAVGHKALARALSDVAAMAGKPLSAVVTLAAPAPADPARLEAVYAGLADTARRYDVGLVGGETVATPGPLLIAVALLGTAPAERCILRRGARPGDALFVSGELGGSLAGRHLTFEPRLAEAAWLAEHFPPHAMIDLSDGLATDLRHLLAAAEEDLGAELLREAIPIGRAAKLRARTGQGRPPLEAALSDGEDFELLFALPAAAAVPLHDAWKQAFPEVRLSCIGRLFPGRGITIRRRDGRVAQPVTRHGYDHFPPSG